MSAGQAPGSTVASVVPAARRHEHFRVFVIKLSHVNRLGNRSVTVRGWQRRPDWTHFAGDFSPGEIYARLCHSWSATAAIRARDWAGSRALEVRDSNATLY